jgi:hypothetical protein
LVISSLTASESALATGEPLAVTKPTGVELIWPRNFVPAMWAASYFRARRQLRGAGFFAQADLARAGGPMGCLGVHYSIALSQGGQMILTADQLPGRWRIGARPQQGLRDDRGPVLLDGQRGRAVQLVPEVQGLADAVAERGVVRAGEHAVPGESIGRHAFESRPGG